MTYTPVPKVEIAFGFGPYDPEPLALDWDDVTDWVLEVQTARGRSAEFDRFQAGTATVTLDNDDRRWDPLNEDGPYYGQLIANLPIRITATVGATIYPIWRGFVDGWPARYVEGGIISETTVNATDAFKVLAERVMPDTYLRHLDTLGRPDAWYRCDSTKNFELANSGTRGAAGAFLSTVTVVDPIVPISAGALSVPEQRPELDEYTAVASIPIPTDSHNLTAGDTWTVAVSAQFSRLGYRGLFSTVLAGGLAAVILSVPSSDGTPFLYIDAGPGITLVASSDVNVADGQPHRLVAVRDGLNAYLYVDGALVAFDGDPGATGAYDGTAGQHLVCRTGVGDGTTTYPACVIDEIMAWAGRALDSSEIADLDTAMTVGSAVVANSGEAIAEVLSLINWPVDYIDYEFGETLVQLPVNPGGQSVLELLHRVAEAENGRLFVDREGKVTYHGRDHDLSESPVTAYTFSDVDRDAVPFDVGLVDGSIQMTIDDRQTYDTAIATRTGGLPQTASNVTYPLRTWTRQDLPLPTDRAALSLAQWVVFRYGTPIARTDTWEIDPETYPSDWDTILGLDIGDRVAIYLTFPNSGGSDIYAVQHLSYIEHTITAESWRIKLNGEPADPNNYLLWDSIETTDADHGWADSDNDPPGGAWG